MPKIIEEVLNIFWGVVFVAILIALFKQAAFNDAKKSAKPQGDGRPYSL